MEAKELLDAGHLLAAIEQLSQEVKAQPTETRRRTFLFELLCFAGQYERARRQLDVLEPESGRGEIGVQMYRNVLAAETARGKLFADGLRPDLPEPEPPYVRLHLEALNRLHEGRPQEAQVLLDESEQTRLEVKGRLDGDAFDSFRDADDVLGPFLEAFVGDRYRWVPFAMLRRIAIPAPRHLRDLLWIPAQFECWDGSAHEAFLPVLYPGSSEHPNERIKLGRMTDWKPGSGDIACGVGQRIFLVDGDERPMLEIREVEFEPG